MKKIFVVLFTLHSSLVLSQEHFSVDVYFDPNSISISDANGNQQSAINTLVNVSVPIKDTDSGHIFLGQSIQYVNMLDEQYMRYAILQIGYSFRSFIFKKMMAGAAINYGLTKRWSQGFTNYGATFDLSYQLNARLKLSSLFQIIRRNDMEVKLGAGTPQIYKTCLFFGLKFDLFRVNYI